MKRFLFASIAGSTLLFAGVATQVWSSSAPPAQGWNYPMSYDSPVAAPDNYKIRYEDDHLRLLEVVVLPGQTEKMHGHPYPSVIFRDTLPPANMKEAKLDPASPLNGQGAGSAGAPDGWQFPICTTMAAEAPYALTNNDSFPLHYYRLEFKRIDGAGLKTNWKSWYPWMLAPIKKVTDLTPGPQLGAPFSKEFPYPIALDSYIAAPNNHQMRYEDSHVRFLEVTMRPGERENLHGHPYPSAFASDRIVEPAPTPKPGMAPQASLEPGLHVGADGLPPAGGVDRPLDPNSPLNGQGGKQGKAPEGLEWPTCSTMGPQAPHQAYNGRTYPSHFFRIEFKRIDGEGLKTNWKTWYPWMAQTSAQ